MNNALLVQVATCLGDFSHEEEKRIESQVSGAFDVLLEGP